MILGVDLGNYGVKTSDKVRFLAKISGVNAFTKNEVKINNKKLSYGVGEFETNYQKARKQNTLPLLYTALSMSNDQLFQVVLGLPIQQYKKNKAELIELIENNKVANINGKDIIITDIEVAPEGASAYYNLPSEIKSDIGKKQLTIVDIGGRTTDICLFQEGGIKDYITLGEGMLNIYSDIVSKVNEVYDQNLVLEDGEEILKEGLFLYGKQQDISFIQPILKRHFDSIFKDLQLRFNVDKGFVLLTGGGSLTLQQPFKNRLNNLIVSNDPVFDNALGFKKVGEQLWQER